MLGPHQSPIYFSMNWSYKFHCFKIMRKKHSCLLKSREIEDYLKTIVELKLFERKLDFLNLFEKLEFRRLLENRSFEN